MPRGKKKKGGYRPAAAVVGANGSGVLDGMHAYHAQLAAECNRIQSAMAALESAMMVMGGGAPAAAPSPVKRGPGRPPGRPAAARPGPRPAGKSLKDYISKVLSGGSILSVKDITQKVQQAGYPTRSNNLSNQVSMALSQMQKAKQLKKVGRGQYTA